ncbi:MAG TPA: uroporphyrinogen-III synthase [Pyrinomonadaceae bacterium]|jgi:uroporphyrinogen III methyltransferase/synthase|nr:uroporphyrinogen-III synthase [Pyrinomonadaceae bacterium]
MVDGKVSIPPQTMQQSFKPLTGRTVIITRARAQAADFISELEGYGARVLACPTIEIVEPESYQPLDEAIDNLYGYDWLIFTSVNGVDHFLRRLTESGRDRSELDDLRVCSIGDATAERLREASVHVDVIPAQFKAEGVFEALALFLGGEENLRGQNFLIPRAAVARDYLPRALIAAGARADVVPAYRTVQPNSSERGRVEAMLTGGAVDCITFTSSSTVNNFALMFETTDLSELLKGVRIACIGDITAATAARYGLNTDIQPDEYTIPALARAIADYYNSKDEG